MVEIMLMPKLLPPQITKENAKTWLVEQYDNIVKEQKPEMYISLAIAEFTDPEYVRGFIACYGAVREALIRQTEQLEAMFKENA